MILVAPATNPCSLSGLWHFDVICSFFLTIFRKFQNLLLIFKRLSLYLLDYGFYSADFEDWNQPAYL